jgi:hypothetical protein
VDSTFSRFNDHWCLAAPVIVDSAVIAALLFIAPEKFTKSQTRSCHDFVDQCSNSLSGLLAEQRLTRQIDQLTEQRRLIQLNDPLGLTQRRGANQTTLRIFDDINLSLDTRTATRGERELRLTRREFDLLDTFLQSPGTALSRVQIIPGYGLNEMVLVPTC